MTKLVIPRTQVTIHYILLELEELAREELFRIKIIKKKKARCAEEAQKTVEICPICNKPIKVDEEKGHREKIEEPKVVCVQKSEPIIAVTAMEELTPTPPPIKETPSPPPRPTQAAPIAPPPKVESIKSLFQPPPAIAVGDPQVIQFMAAVDPETLRLEHLKKLLAEIIRIAMKVETCSEDKINIQDFLVVCKEAKEWIDYFLDTTPAAEIDNNLKNRLEHLRLHLREVIELTQNSDTILSSNLPHFIETCEGVSEKLCGYITCDKSKSMEEATKARLLNLKQQIKDVVEMTEDYKAQGLLTQSAEEFVKTCDSVQLKIDEYVKDQPTGVSTDRIGHLKDHVGQLERLTSDIKQEGLATCSLEKLMQSCRGFKDKLEEYKKRAKPLYDCDICKLVQQLEETIDLSMTAKQEGLIDESVDDFVNTCERIKALIETKPEEERKPQTLCELKSNIGGVIRMIKGLKAEGMVTESVENFLKSCEMARDRIEVYERYPLPCTKPIKREDSCCTGTCKKPAVETHTCNKRKVADDDEGAICDKCIELAREPVEPVLPYVPEPCDSCRGIIKTEHVEDFPCESCTKPEPTTCFHCKKDMDVEESPQDHTCPTCPSSPPPEEPTASPSPEDSSLGYFEKKIKKIVRVTRTMNEDGTIREETETIVQHWVQQERSAKK